MTPIPANVEEGEKDPEILSVVDKARALTITNDEQYRYVDEFCVWLKHLEKKTVEKYADTKKKAHEAWKGVVAMESEDLDKVVEARKIAKYALIGWDNKQAAIRVAEESRLRAEAKKQAEDEAIAKAERAAEFGDDKAADAIMAAPVVVAPVVLPPAPKSATVLQTRWKMRIMDATKIPREYMVPNEVMLRGLATATKGAVKIEGVEFYAERC